MFNITNTHSTVNKDRHSFIPEKISNQNVVMTPNSALAFKPVQPYIASMILCHVLLEWIQAIMSLVPLSEIQVLTIASTSTWLKPKFYHNFIPALFVHTKEITNFRVMAYSCTSLINMKIILTFQPSISANIDWLVKFPFWSTGF